MTGHGALADHQERSLAVEVIERWKGLRDQALADSAWQSELARERAFRQEVGPKILTLMRGFLDGAVSLVEFQSTLDRKSRTEWNILGIKGASGAMFLNMLVKHIPDQADLVSLLHAALPLPVDNASGESEMLRFYDALNGFVAARQVTVRQVQPARTPFLFSAFWYLQDAEAWPVYYLSARGVFSREGLFHEAPNSNPVDNYFTFRRLWRELSTALGLDALSLEHLILRIEQHGQPVRPPERSTIPADELTPGPAPALVEESGSLHAQAQWLLASIGRRLGYKVWIASNDRSRRWEGQALGDLSVSALPPLGAGGATQRTVELIDVLWISGYNAIVAAFEVEHSTAIYSGLLRMSDLAVLAPLVSFPIYIVAPAARLEEVRRQLRRPTFQALELHKRAAFFSIEALAQDADNIMKFANSAAAIDALAERVGDVGGDEGWQ